MADTWPETTCIVGVGLLGGSFGLALKGRGLTGKVVGVSRTQTTLDTALHRGAIDEASDDPRKGVEGADLVVLCTPVGAIARVAQMIAPHLRPGCLLTDVGSVKRPVVEEIEPLATGWNFLGGHPLAGSEHSGVANAVGTLFVGKTYFLTPTENTSSEALERMSTLVRDLGANPLFLTAEEHDRIVAITSHLPHLGAGLICTLFAEEASNKAVPSSAIGNGFLDTTRVAAGDAVIWRDICLANKDFLLPMLERLGASTAALADLLRSEDEESLLAWLRRAQEVRQRLYPESPTSE